MHLYGHRLRLHELRHAMLQLACGGHCRGMLQCSGARWCSGNDERCLACGRTTWEIDCATASHRCCWVWHSVLQALLREWQTALSLHLQQGRVAMSRLLLQQGLVQQNLLSVAHHNHREIVATRRGVLLSELGTAIIDLWGCTTIMSDA